MRNQIIRFKKVIFGSLIAFLIFPFLVKPTVAFETPTLNYGIQFEEALSMDEMNLQSFVNETVKAVAASINKLVLGKFWAEKEERSKSPGLLGSTTSIIAGLYANPPASGVQYFADLGRRLGITKQVYAEDPDVSSSGFIAMKITQPIWTAFRNISYLLLVLLLVAMGFAIMFRLKISPQAVITIQSALPKIVLALILITFSYAIVGLMLDVAFFLCRIISGIFRGLTFDLFKDNATAFFNGASGFFSSGNVGGIGLGVLTANMVIFLAAPVILMFAIGFLLPVGIILELVIGILLLIAFIRALWVLIRSFAMIVLSLIFGPFQILMGVLPGTNAMGAWFKNLFANVAVLPVMATMFFLGGYLILAGTMGSLTQFFGDGAAVLTDIATFNFKAAIEKGLEGFVYSPFWLINALIFPFIGIFVILMIPKAADIIQSVITKKPFQYGTAFGEAIGPVAGPIRGAYQTIRGGIEKQQQADIGQIYTDHVAPIRERFMSKIKTDNTKTNIVTGGKQEKTNEVK